MGRGRMLVMVVALLALVACGSPAALGSTQPTTVQPTATVAPLPAVENTYLVQPAGATASQADVHATLEAATGLTFTATVDASQTTDGSTTFQGYDNDTAFIFGVKPDGTKTWASVVARMTGEGQIASADLVERFIQAWNKDAGQWALTQIREGSPTTFMARCRVGSAVTDFQSPASAGSCNGPYVERDVSAQGGIIHIQLPA